MNKIEIERLDKIWLGLFLRVWTKISKYSAGNLITEEVKQYKSKNSRRFVRVNGHFGVADKVINF